MQAGETYAHPQHKALATVWVACMLATLLNMITTACIGQATANDSTRQAQDLLRLLDSAAVQSRRQAADFKAERLMIQQRRLFEQMEETAQKATDYLRRRIDTKGIDDDLTDIDRWVLLADTGLHRPDYKAVASFRDVVTTARILTALQTVISQKKHVVERHARTIDGYLYTLDSLRADSLLVTLPTTDPATAHTFVQQVKYVTEKISVLDSTLTRTSLQANGLLARVNAQLGKTSRALERLNAVLHDISTASFDKEVQYFWDMTTTSGEWSRIAGYSATRAVQVLLLYGAGHGTEITIALLALVVCSVYLYLLRHALKEEHLLHPDAAGQLVLRYPILSALVIVTSLFQFIFPDPPAIFNLIIWTAAALSLTIIFSRTVHPYWMKIWCSFLALFFVSGIFNLMLSVSTAERWTMLLLAIAGVGVAAVALLGKKTELRERGILYFIALVLLMQAGCIVANVLGRYNLSKNLFTTGYAGLVIGILFLWTVRLINQGLGLSFHIYTIKDRSLLGINFEKVGTRTPFLLHAGLVLGWCILFARNFYVFKLVSEPLKAFVLMPRTVGTYTFSVMSMLMFVAIMGLAALVARIVSFFAADRPRNRDGRAGIGSLLLLVRIAILGMGLFFALAAAGMSLDKVTVVIGALSLGIGFGLQTLVNNLVSGLIIAFERPVNVGDIVEVEGKVGVMKSIGFRSSRIGIWEGADVIVPNGNLLSGQLINWTDNDASRRVDIDLGVAYGTDLRSLEALIQEVLKNDKDVLGKPAPVVLFQGFGDSAINVKVLFWVSHFNEGGRVKSNVIIAIDATFREKGIVIPYPQQNITVHTATRPPGATDA